MRAGYDPAARDAILDQRGRGGRGAVPRRRRARHRPAGQPRRSGRASDRASASTRRRSRPAPGPTTAGSPTSAPPTPSGASAWRSCPSPPASTTPSPRSRRRPSRGLRGIMIPTRWFDAPAYLDPSYDPVWAACAEAGPRGPHPLGRRARPTTRSAPGSWPSTPPRRGGGRPVRSGCWCCRACSSATRR